MVEPRFPGVVHLVQNLEERRQAGQLHQVQPGLVQDPALWLRFYRVQVQRGSAYTDRETTFTLKGLWRMQEKKGGGEGNL